MSSEVLLIEPDIALRELITAVLTDYGLTTQAATPSSLKDCLHITGLFKAVFWSATSQLTEAQLELVRNRPSEERWIVMLGSEEDDQHYPSEPFQAKLTTPFRSSDLVAVLEAEPRPPEDALLKFMRAREQEFSLFRKKESQLREAHRHQQDMERMKNTFLSLVSHELRTPLTIIAGNLHVLKKLASKWNNTIATECVGSAFEGTTRLSKLVDELLRFTVSVPQSRDRWDLALTLRRVVGELQPLAANRGLSLQFGCSNPLNIEGDPAGLPDAIHQLIENALLFNKPGGEVDVKARPIRKGQWLEVSVVDDGPGIESSELDKIFHPFYQVADVNTRTVEGLGIGLSLARRTIESHGGTLVLKSTVGEGTKAIVNLPIRSQLAIPLATGPSLPQPPANEDVGELKAYAQELYECLEAERVRRRHAEEQKRVLEQTFVETLVSLIRMVDPRISGGTSQGERVLEYARAIARRLDPTLLSRPEFLYGLLLYDIGKLELQSLSCPKQAS